MEDLSAECGEEPETGGFGNRFFGVRRVSGRPEVSWKCHRRAQFRENHFGRVDRRLRYFPSDNDSAGDGMHRSRQHETGGYHHERRHLSVARCLLLLAGGFVLSCNYHDEDPRNAFEHAQQTLVQGRLALAQQEAEQGSSRVLSSSPEWSWKFKILESDALMAQGLSDRALTLLKSSPAHPNSPQFSIPVLTLEGLAYARLHQFGEADQT